MVSKTVSHLASVIAPALLALAAVPMTPDDLDPDPDRVTFHVLDTEGHPIAGAHLVSSGFWCAGGGEWDAYSDANGRFTVPPIVVQTSHAHGALVAKEGFAPRMLPP